MRTGRAIALLASLTLAVAACGDDGADDDSAGMRSGGQGGDSEPAEQAGCDIEDGASGRPVAEVHGELAEYTITIERDKVPSGLVRLEFDNVGALAHEVAIVRAGDPSTVPTTPDGAADDEALGDDLLGEIEPFEPGATCAGTFDLAPGDYVLLCNVVEGDDGREAHMAEGMVTTLEVTA